MNETVELCCFCRVIIQLRQIYCGVQCKGTMSLKRISSESGQLRSTIMSARIAYLSVMNRSQ